MYRTLFQEGNMTMVAETRTLDKMIRVIDPEDAVLVLMRLV